MHEDAQVRTEDWNATEGVSMEPCLLKCCLHAWRNGPTVQPRGDLVDVLGYQDGLCKDEHGLRTHR